MNHPLLVEKSGAKPPLPATPPLNIPPAHRKLLRFVWFSSVLTVVVLSLLPSSSLPLRAIDSLDLNDKFEHFAAYAVLAFLPALHERWNIVLYIALSMVALGVGLEFGQLLSPSRSFDRGDMLADLCGVLFGIIIGLPSRRWLRHYLEGSTGWRN